MTWENKINTTSGPSTEKKKEKLKDTHGNLSSWRISMSMVIPGIDVAVQTKSIEANEST